MVALTFPDGARREYPANITGLDIAKGISPSLAKRTVAMALDGNVADLADPIEKDAKIEFLTREDSRATKLSPKRSGRATKPSACSRRRARTLRSSWSMPFRLANN